MLNDAKPGHWAIYSQIAIGPGKEIQCQQQQNAMVVTVESVFTEFIKATVSLDPEITRVARKSRDWLVTQIHSLEEKNHRFPKSYSEKDIYYGSFARRTKIRDLDDIDLIACMSAEGAAYLQTDVISIIAAEGTRLQGLCFDDSNIISSRRVVNAFVKQLSDIPQYKAAQIGRNGAAAVLNLSSYDWSFDVVPGFFTKPEYDGRTYYLIPDGNGHWIKTDPRKDQERVTRINQKHAGEVLNIVRLIKYWNRRATMPSAPSYLLECIILDYFDARSVFSIVNLSSEIQLVLNYIASAVFNSVQDPKLIQGNINELSLDEKQRIATRAKSDAQKAYNAMVAEQNNNPKEAITLWGQIFGPSFLAS